MVQAARTSITELSDPWGLGTFCRALGSSTHSPSATNLYWYRPGGKARVVFQSPSPCRFKGVACGDQALNSPHKETCFAWGALKENATGTTLLGGVAPGFSPRAVCSGVLVGVAGIVGLGLTTMRGCRPSDAGAAGRDEEAADMEEAGEVAPPQCWPGRCPETAEPEENREASPADDEPGPDGAGVAGGFTAASGTRGLFVLSIFLFCIISFLSFITGSRRPSKWTQRCLYC